MCTYTKETKSGNLSSTPTLVCFACRIFFVAAQQAQPHLKPMAGNPPQLGAAKQELGSESQQSTFTQALKSFAVFCG